MSTARNQSFFKVFVLEHSVHRMKIPSPYQKHMSGKKSGTVYLRGPSGHRWSVELIKESGELYFAKGWPKFMKDHSIQEWHFLVFKFDGNQTFKVKLYSPTGCEEKAALTAKPSQGGVSTPHKHVEVKLEDDAENRAGSGVLPGPSAPTYPYFMVQLKAHSVRDPNKGMVLGIPRSFFKTHMSHIVRTTPIRLQWEDKEWPASVSCTNGRSYICKGWREFVGKSEVQEGDSCKIELLDRYTVRVHTFNHIKNSR